MALCAVLRVVSVFVVRHTGNIIKGYVIQLGDEDETLRCTDYNDLVFVYDVTEIVYK